MKIAIEAAGFDAGQDLRHFIRCCAGFELGTFRDRIESVTVRLGSLKEALDGRNKTCLVEVDLPGPDRVSSRAADADMYVAIYWALERAGWTVAQQLERERLHGDGLPSETPRAQGSGETNRAA